mmetsp:Transcript_1327/g.1932  ORF Transcript_1327/g.1932 Transcript_1327/m.1932 type:complete len:83 (-) Transcript_1327:470-718(-)
MTEDLHGLINNLRKWRSSFVNQKEGNFGRDKATIASGGQENSSSPIRKKKKNNAKHSSSLTKKEQRKVASNWKNMLSIMGKN